MKYPIGFRYISRSNRKEKRVTTITNFLTVTNHNGEVVKTYYEGEETFCDQTIVIRDIVQTTIDRAEHLN